MNCSCVSTCNHPMKTTSVSVSPRPVSRWRARRQAAVSRPLGRAVQAVLLGLAMGLAAPSLLAQATAAVPERMTYQGFLTDGNGVALGNTAPKNYDIIFRIYNHENASAPANLLWAEQQTVTVDKGYFSVLLGEGSPVGEPRPALSTLFRGPTASERWVGITVKGLGPGGANVDILPRLRLLSGPYAFLAQQANKLVQDDGSDLLVSSGNQLTLQGGLRVVGAGVFELGAGLPKHAFAGLIGYGIFTPGALDIVGGGLSGSDRVIKFWAEGGSVFTGPVTASSFSGSGAGLFGLNAAQITTGVLPDERLSANVARRDQVNIFAANNQMNGHLRVGNIGNFPLGSPGYGNALVFSGGPDLSNTWNNDNSDPLWIARYNVAENQTELRINIGDDPGGSTDKLVVGTTSLGGADFTFSGIWTPVMTVQASGRLELRGGLSAYGGLQETFNWGLRLRDPNDVSRFVDYNRHANGFSFTMYGANYHNSGTRTVTYDGDNNWDFSSDRRLKKDIEDAEPMLERALKIPVRRYRWNDEDERAKHKLGVIAQEVQPLFPDLVGQHADREGGEPVLTVGYSDFGLIAIKALQELAARHQSEAAELREQLRKQEELIATQARELEALRSHMTALRSVVQDLVTARAAEPPVPTRATAWAETSPEP